MPFKLTKEWVSDLFSQAATGNPTPFINAIHPDVKWRMASDKKDLTTKTGIYNRQEWMDNILTQIKPKLKDGEMNLIPSEVEVVGNKVYFESKTEATQKNGQPYNLYHMSVLIFNDEGHIVEIREYLDTALVRDLFTNN